MSIEEFSLALETYKDWNASREKSGKVRIFLDLSIDMLGVHDLSPAFRVFSKGLVVARTATLEDALDAATDLMEKTTRENF